MTQYGKLTIIHTTRTINIKHEEETLDREWHDIAWLEKLCQPQVVSLADMIHNHKVVFSEYFQYSIVHITYPQAKWQQQFHDTNDTTCQGINILLSNCLSTSIFCISRPVTCTSGYENAVHVKRQLSWQGSSWHSDYTATHGLTCQQSALNVGPTHFSNIYFIFVTLPNLVMAIINYLLFYLFYISFC